MAQEFSSLLNSLQQELSEDIMKHYVKNALDFMFHIPTLHQEFHWWFINAGDSELLSVYVPQNLYKHYLNIILGHDSKQMFNQVVSKI